MLIETGYGLSLNRKNNAGGGGPSYLDSVIASVCCDLDATQSVSYGGSGQIWANLIASPADGAAQTDYDVHLGFDNASSTDDPAFNGTAGDSAAYWSFDGGDHFKLAAANSAPDDGSLNPPAIRNASKTTGGTDFTAIVTFKTPSTLDHLRFFDTGYKTTTVFNNGMYALYNKNTDKITFGQKQGGTHSSVNSGVLSMATDTDYILAVGYDHAAEQAYFALNATSFSSAALAFSTGANNPDSALTVAALGTGTGSLPNGSRMYSFAWFDEKLSDANLAAVISHLETRHGRDYTGT